VTLAQIYYWYRTLPHIQHPRRQLLFVRLKLYNERTTTGESDSGGQASNLVVVLGDNVGKNGVLSWWNLRWERDILLDRHLALLKWALQVDVTDSVAEVGGLSDNGDQAILDLQVYLGALLDVLVEVAGGGDGKVVTTMEAISDLAPAGQC